MESELIAAVIAEATAIKEHATKEEKDNLSFINLSPGSASECIYGQMTGHCANNRSKELIGKCATKTVKRHTEVNMILPYMEDIYIDYGGIPGRDYVYLSALEDYIMSPSIEARDNNSSIIDFIKGYKDTLEL